MDAGAKLLTQVPQPRQSAVGGFGHAALHIEVEDRFRTAPELGQPPPARFSRARRPVTVQTAPDELNCHLVAIRGPVVLKIIKKSWPVVRKVMPLEVAEGEGKCMVDAHKSRRAVAKFVREPLGYASPSPILLRARWRWYLSRLPHGRG